MRSASLAGPLTDMLVTATAIEVPTRWPLPSARRRPQKAMGQSRIGFRCPNLFPIESGKSSVLVRASQPQREESNANSTNNSFISPEDLNYLWKLGAGSFVGAAVIKYGSILFPQITLPNILQALIMISAPVVIAVVLLVKQSLSK